MKSRISLMVALGFLGAVLLNPVPYAQPGSEAAKPVLTEAERQQQLYRERINRLGEELKLTTEQREKLLPIFKEEAERLRLLREKTDLTPEQKREKYKELRELTSTKIKPILSAEQWEKWEKFRLRMLELARRQWR